MGRPKKVKKPTAEMVGEYLTEVTYTCPVRGKITEKVKVKKIKTKNTLSRISVNADDIVLSLGEAESMGDDTTATTIAADDEHDDT